MAHLLDDKRVVRISIGEEKDSSRCPKFSIKTGELLDGDLGDKELTDRLSLFAREQPLSSFTKDTEIEYNNKKLPVHIKAYIDVTLSELPQIMAGVMQDRTAVRDPLGKTTLSYNDILTKSTNLAKKLVDMGIKKGEHAAVIMDNCYEQVVVKFALAMCGAVIVNMNYHEKLDGLRTQMKDDDCVAAFIKQAIPKKEHMDLFYQMCPEILFQDPHSLKTEALPLLRFLVVTEPNKPRVASLKLDDLISQGEKLDDAALRERMKEISPFDSASVIHTSGSTGKPKSVLMHHSALIENAINHIEALGMTQDDRLCMTPPMFHALGAVGALLTTFLAGGTVICYDNAGGIPLYDMLVNEKATVLISVPTIYISLCRTIQALDHPGELGSIRLCVTAGAPCPPSLVNNIREIIGSKDMIGMYGMTETGPGLTSHGLGDSDEVICNTVGHFWNGTEYKFLNPETGGIAEPDEPGEICVRGYMLMQEYYHNPVETAKIFDADGWLHTGDLGVLRPDGNVELKGRIKELIIRCAENISPIEVETCLMDNEDIINAAVVGAPDDENGEWVCGYVTVRKGSPLTPDAIKKWCKGRIATLKIPQKLEILKEMPVLPTGKTDKALLRKLAAKKAAEDKKKQ